ncbi:MAG: L-threonylcarbamoyladenylate synthase [Phycisphaerales bacterium]
MTDRLADSIMPRLVEPTQDAIAEASRLLERGQLVVFPTETVYGLGADTTNAKAIELIYALKGRPADNPLIAHVLDDVQARRIVARWDDRCARLSEHFWPGPLTLVVARGEVPASATAGLDTIAVRAPRHVVARALLHAFGRSISAPSANRSGRVSPTTAEHVVADFPEADELLVLDGGACEIGIESTVLELTDPTPRVLRPGAIMVERLREVLGEVGAPPVTTQLASPGTSLWHYAPRTPAELVETTQLAQRLAGGVPAAVLCFEPASVNPPHVPVPMPRSAEPYAARLYDALRTADATGVSRIIIEQPQETHGPWVAIHDRLRRATGHADLDGNDQ